MGLLKIRTRSRVKICPQKEWQTHKKAHMGVERQEKITNFNLAWLETPKGPTPLLVYFD